MIFKKFFNELNNSSSLNPYLALAKRAKINLKFFRIYLRVISSFSNLSSILLNASFGDEANLRISSDNVSNWEKTLISERNIFKNKGLFEPFILQIKSMQKSFTTF